eukprot:m.350008 g.350008  ORF g.350008 m.350008 type:complete len:53 (-) comp55891_c0_seq4:328-486(-)
MDLLKQWSPDQARLNLLVALICFFPSPFEPFVLIPLFVVFDLLDSTMLEMVD